MHFFVTVVGEHTVSDLERYEPGGAEEAVDYFEETHGGLVVTGGAQRWAERDLFCIHAHLAEVARVGVIPAIMEAETREEALKLYEAISEALYRSGPLDRACAGEIDWVAMKRKGEARLREELAENEALLTRMDGGNSVLAEMFERLVEREDGESDADLVARSGWFATTMLLDLRGGAGKWYSKNECLSGGEVSQLEWERSMHEFCAGLDPDTLVSVYHCHA